MKHLSSGVYIIPTYRRRVPHKIWRPNLVDDTTHLQKERGGIYTSEGSGFVVKKELSTRLCPPLLQQPPLGNCHDGVREKFGALQACSVLSQA